MLHRCTAVLLLALPFVAQAAGPAAVLEMSADGEVQIAPDGHVSDYRLTSTLAPAVVALVDRHVRDWRFEPVLVDGKPVVAKTRMTLRLRAEPNGEGAEQFRVRVVDASFGDPRHVGKMAIPRYPEEAVRRHLGAKVVLTLRLDETGKVADVLPYQTSLNMRASSEQEAEQYRRQFERSSIAAARSWRFDLTEFVNGKSMGATVMLPVVYNVMNLGERPKEGWQAYVPGPVHVAPWAGEHVADTRDVAALPPYEAAALDSRVHLKEPVAGKLL